MNWVLKIFQVFTNVSPNKRRWHCLPGSHSTSESLLSVALFLNYCTNSTIHISTGIKQINSTEFKIFSSCKTVVHILISSNMYINIFKVRNCQKCSLCTYSVGTSYFGVHILTETLVK